MSDKINKNNYFLCSKTQPAEQKVTRAFTQLATNTSKTASLKLSNSVWTAEIFDLLK